MFLRKGLRHPHLMSNLYPFRVRHREMYASAFPNSSLLPLLYTKKKTRDTATTTAATKMINKAHFLLIPMMAQGHMLPMVDMARLLAGRGGARVTFVTTPLNADRIRPIIDGVEQLGLDICFLTLPFPSMEVGLPEGCESVDNLPSRDLFKNFLEAFALFHSPLIVHLRSHAPPPTCVIADIFHPWAHGLARELSVPRLVFHGFGCFPLLSWYNIRLHKVHDNDSDDVNEPFPVPGMPHRVELSKAQSLGYPYDPRLQEFREKAWAAEGVADGVVVNTFDDLEPSCCEWYAKAMGKPVWTIGPMSLYNRDAAEIASRGNKSAIDEGSCFSWLDAMRPGSVLYVSFGSLARTSPSQLAEIGLGLEASGFPFVWAIKAGDKLAAVEEWLSEGFEERTSGRGLVIKGWAPQVAILSHPAVGGFVTHCGWNSTLEAVSLGVSMVTWPMWGDQFLNEKLVVDVLKVAVSLGVKSPTGWGTGSSDEVMVSKDEIERAVRRLMDEGEEMRERAKKLQKAAREAMGEGGSSHSNLLQLVQLMSPARDDNY